MTTQPTQPAPHPDPAILQWLLDSDPSIRWQVLHSFSLAPAHTIAKERARIAVEGYGARLLALQGPHGQWDAATWKSPDRTSTFDTLSLLAQLGIDPQSPQARRAIDRVLTHNVNWGPEFGSSPFFEGETEACINARTLAAGIHFGHTSEKLLQRLLSEQLPDGGWNCYAPPSSRSSFHSTLCVLEALLAYESAHAPTPATTRARHLAQEYLLHRRLLRTASTGNIINLQWTMLSFPNYWHYDILWALDYLRRAGVPPDVRMAEAIQRIQSKRTPSGHWLLEHVLPGKVHFDMEDGPGKPSRWITLRALRVLNWYSASPPA